MTSLNDLETRSDFIELDRAGSPAWASCPVVRSGVQELCVMFDVIAHEGVDEEVAVVVSLQYKHNTRL